MGPYRGRSSVVERQLPKLNVVGSIPIARSNHYSDYEASHLNGRLCFLSQSTLSLLTAWSDPVMAYPLPYLFIGREKECPKRPNRPNANPDAVLGSDVPVFLLSETSEGLSEDPSRARV